MVTILLAACARVGGGSPAASPLDLAAVTAALRSAGVAVVDVADNLNPHEGAWQCLPGSFRLARVSQQPQAALALPGDKPSVDILLFSSDAERAAAQAAIGADGQVQAQGRAAMVDWVATPHVVSARNVLLFVATDDPAAFAALKAAAARLGG
ncbi:MAG: hypothetical protein M3O78_03115 [Chloroflexota bacterium]|nr:hypothetical protein [Chloroflexota bacterium]